MKPTALPAQHPQAPWRASGGPPWAFLLLAALFTVPAGAESRFPPPDFVQTQHVVPTATTPAPPAWWWDAIDVALLAGMLALVSYLVLRRRSRRGVMLAGAASLAYFGFYRLGCVCPIGSIQNVALALGQPGYALPWVVGAFFALPVLATLWFGRSFCAGVCPLGAIQELVILRPVQIPRWVDESLGLLRYAYLAAALLLAATGSAFVICRYDPFVGFFRLDATVAMLLFGAVLLLLGTVVARPYCRFLCPYGLLLGWTSRLAKWHARIDPTDCINCHLCADSCPVNAILPPTPPPAEDDAPRPHAATLAWVLLPAMILVGALLGWLSMAALAGLHPDVHLARQVLHSQGDGAALTEEHKAWRAMGRSDEAAIARAAPTVAVFRWATPTSGALLGLVLGLKLLRMMVPRQRLTYDIDRSRCVACARCLAYCPHDSRNAIAGVATAPAGSALTALTLRGRHS